MQIYQTLGLLKLVHQLLNHTQQHVSWELVDMLLPSNVSTGHLYVKSDVHGFGVVLVEILTALRVLDTTRPPDKQNLIDWIKPFLTDRRKLKKVMDSRLEGIYHSKATNQIAQLASMCLGREPKSRPSMKES